MAGPLVANILQPLIDVGEWILVSLHDIGISWGLAIILLTFMTRILILPLSLTGIRSMRKLQVHAPKLKAISERYKDDPQRKQREMMQFYQENKINPFASCLPFILQIPFFMALFFLLRSDEFREDLERSGEVGWLMIPNLAESATGAVLILLLALYLGTFIISMLVSSVQATPQQRALVIILPVVFTPIVITFPSGLVVYWIATNVWTIGQQFVVNKVMPPPPKPSEEELEELSKPPPPPPRRKRRKR